MTMPKVHQDLVTFVFNLFNAQANVIPPQGPPATPITPRNTKIKWKQLNVFSPIIDVTIKNSKELVEAMDRINQTQLEIEDHHTNVQLEIEECRTTI
jgi:hypothetical protein